MVQQTKIKCLIIDDEAPGHQVLHAHIARTDLLEIVGDVYDGEEAIAFMNQHKVDVLFLDIEMPKLNGLELLECLPYPVSVILTTAYSNFGFEAYQNGVLDYLLKPISYPRFLKALNKLTTVLGVVQVPVESFVYPLFEVKHEGVQKQINSEELSYIESIGNYLKINLKNGKTLIVTQTMKYISSLLPSTHFTRIHKSYLVNRSEIVEIGKGELTLTSGQVLPIGRRYSVLLEA